MARYLLGTQCFVDIAKRANLIPEQWLEDLDPRRVPGKDVQISAVTPMILTWTFDQEAKSPYNEALRQLCESLVKRFVFRKRVVPVTKEIADRWGQLLAFDLKHSRPDGTLEDYDYRERLVMATAIEGVEGLPFVLVDKRQAAHAALAPLGLQLEDPYERHR